MHSMDYLDLMLKLLNIALIPALVYLNSINKTMAILQTWVVSHDKQDDERHEEMQRRVGNLEGS